MLIEELNKNNQQQLITINLNTKEVNSRIERTKTMSKTKLVVSQENGEGKVGRIRTCVAEKIAANVA